MEWISVKDRQIPKDKEFIAAVPYNDSMKPNENNLWWIRHCVIDNGELCIVGDIDNESSGYDPTDVTHWMPLPKPPKTFTDESK